MKKIFILLLFIISTCYADDNLISSIIVKPNKIIIVPSQAFKKVFQVPDFFVEYEDEELDLTQLPYSIVILPFVVHAFPMILRSGKTFYVDQLDADFHMSMAALKNVFEDFYPKALWNGKLIARELVRYSFEQSPLYEENKGGIISPYSNGIDSMYNALSTLDKKQQLITLYGGDVPLQLNEMWHHVKKGCKQFCDNWGCYFSTFKSNFSHLYTNKKRFNNMSLWTMATQSLSYSGLIAPLTIAKGYPYILIGSAVTAELPLAYGSHPLLEHVINYAGVKVIHFGGECTRADKIRFIIQKVKEHNIPIPYLRVCWGKKDQGKNCCECINKCLPTIHGLLAEGVDPREYGFEAWTPEGMIKFMKEFFEKEKTMHEDRASIWNSIKNRIIEQQKAGLHFDQPLQDYFAWLAEQNFMNRVNKRMRFDIKKKRGVLFKLSMDKAYKEFHNYYKALA